MCVAPATAFTRGNSRSSVESRIDCRASETVSESTELRRNLEKEGPVSENVVALPRGRCRKFDAEATLTPDWKEAWCSNGDRVSDMAYVIAVYSNRIGSL
jgi:hypothetical protein